MRRVRACFFHLRGLRVQHDPLLVQYEESVPTLPYVRLWLRISSWQVQVKELRLCEWDRHLCGDAVLRSLRAEKGRRVRNAYGMDACDR